MARYYMTEIKVEGFRGINNEGDPLRLKFAPDCVNSVFAINGYGKSSLFEALSYAIRGSVPKLDALQAAERRDEDYYCNRFHSQGKATIDLEFAPDDGSQNLVRIVVERDASGNRTVTSPTNHPNPEQFLSALNEDFTLLDYKTFARFIDDTPLNRGRSFSALLGLSAYSDTRQALQAAADTRTFNTDFDTRLLGNTVRTSREAARKALAGAVANYERVTGTPLTDVANLDIANANVGDALRGVVLLAPLIGSTKLEEIDFDDLKRAVREAEGGERRRDLEKVVEDIAALEALGAPDSEAIQADLQSLRQLIGDRDTLLEGTRGELFKNLFEAAHAVVHDESWTADATCPLCEGEMESPVRGYVEQQLQQYTGVAAKDAAIVQELQGSALSRRLLALEGSVLLRDDATEAIARRIGNDARSAKLTKETLEAGADRLAELEQKIISQLAALQERKESLERELPQSLVQLTEQLEYARQFQLSISQHLEQVANANSAQARVDVRTRWKEFIDKASQVFAEAEGTLAGARIAAIETEYKDTFRAIMNVTDVVPRLKRGDASEDLFVQLSDFHGQPAASARALLSESYINALAISVYLAAALKHTGAPRFLVLDDVTSSFDAGHQLALMEVIRQRLQQPANAAGLQFFIISHDGLLEKYFDRLGNDGAWRHHRLQGSPPMGHILGQSQDANRLRSNLVTLLNAGQIPQAEPLIRQYLEFRLLQIIRKLDVPVPIDFAMKETNRMVSNCIDAISKAVDLHRRAGTLVLDQAQVQALSNVHVPSILGNWCSHYETASASSLSGPMLLNVLQTVDNFSECFRWDDTSGGVVQRRWYRSLSSRA